MVIQGAVLVLAAMLIVATVLFQLHIAKPGSRVLNNGDTELADPGVTRLNAIDRGVNLADRVTARGEGASLSCATLHEVRVSCCWNEQMVLTLGSHPEIE